MSAIGTTALRGAFAATCAAAMLAGCAAERQGATNGTGLTADMIRAEGIAVVGVVVVDEVEQIRQPLVDALERSLLYWRPDIAVTSAGRMREQLGASAYRRILNGFQQRGVLSETDRGELTAALRNVARFLVLARVEKDAIHVAGHGTLRTSTVSGSVGSIGVGVSSRNTKVRILLYDTKIGETIQSAVYTSSSDFVPPEGRPPSPGTIFIPGPGYQPEPHEDPAPSLPALVDALLEAFRAFAQDLPGPVLPPLEATDSLRVRQFQVTPYDPAYPLR